MRRCSSFTLSIFLLFASYSLVFAAKDELPEVTEDGLHRVHESKAAIVYAEPGATLADYDSVMLLEAHVAFQKNWERNQRTKSVTSNRIRSSDIEKIKNNLAREFDAIFTQTLEEGGYPVVDHAGETVLLIRPAIINLDITAPDTPSASFTRNYISSAGEMTLYLEIYDSVTGDMIAKAMDRKTDNTHANFYTWSNSSTNKAAAVRILKGWSEILLAALNEAKTQEESETWITPAID